MVRYECSGEEKIFMTSILVTGGAECFGSHACETYWAGHTPVVLDNLSTGHRWAVKWGPPAVADFVDSGCVSQTVKEHGIKAVIHFAAQACVSAVEAVSHRSVPVIEGRRRSKDPPVLIADPRVARSLPSSWILLKSDLHTIWCGSRGSGTKLDPRNHLRKQPV
jgi:UDP-glucose 4-epimerase